MKSIVLCIVGAGGSYTPEIVEGVLEREGLAVAEISLTDADPERLAVMAGLTRRMIAAKGAGIAVREDRDLARAVEGADFVVTQIRVGGMAARQIDETIPPRYGVIGQETTGPGGMFKALRTIPVMIDIARTIAQVAPNAFILNYTNPSGIVTEAVLNHTDAKLLGLCSSIPLLQHRLKRLLADPFGPVEIGSVGLNHLGFVHSIVTVSGEDVTAAAIAYLASRHGANDNMFASALHMAPVLGAIPVEKYGDLYFHRRAEAVIAAAAKETRAQAVMTIEAEVLAEAADPAVSAKPQALIRRGGEGYSGVTFDTLDAVLNDRGAKIVMSALNRGAVAGLPDDVAVETVCHVDASGARPLPVGEIPLPFRGLVQAVKAHESLTVQAAVTRSRDVALQALLAHPLVGDIDIAEPMLDELLQAHGLDYR
ncbi:6-phospho-beta-glucosidase [Caulobacter mirabilis]|uniref:6-phospho-beta-glucosidase n=1 Tax=Caulobacter mirabilis TaxID=69666 RepID=A0A2D2AW55_9CAUL|nr:6-phospho-beta-glucosidase [Caulobacter mirabilis]ATQ42248.1 6-phospho-beta-glucosidase [Caulobacter mirabilis]